MRSRFRSTESERKVPRYASDVCDTAECQRTEVPSGRKRTETMEVIESRMNRACEEAEGMSAYDYLVVNDELDDCVEEMHSIIQENTTEVHAM